MLKVKIATLSVLGAAIGLAGIALAAEPIAPPAPPPAPTVPPPAPAPVKFDWTGFYVGLNGGFGWGQEDVGAEAFGNLYPIGVLNNSGFFAGGQLGFNFQTGMFVFGVEADAQWSWIDGFLANETDYPVDLYVWSSVDWFATLRARAGVALDRTLIYATGGLAVGQYTYYTETDPVIAGLDSQVRSDTFFGWVAGAGIEQAVTDNISVKLEYQYVNLGSEVFTYDPGFDVTTVPTANFHTVRLGANFLF